MKNKEAQCWLQEELTRIPQGWMGPGLPNPGSLGYHDTTSQLQAKLPT